MRKPDVKGSVCRYRGGEVVPDEEGGTSTNVVDDERRVVT